MNATSAKILLKEPAFDWVTATAAFLAGLFPAIFKALDVDTLKGSNRIQSLPSGAQDSSFASHAGKELAVEGLETGAGGGLRLRRPVRDKPALET